ncbi:hypothetical protein PSE_p0213 (plasmid) [Pseudovibrio sp. FO-BEG1]|nr:hypothetical protein PSE_p0213 [Pseudovibrio sp. FO-BEG1]
MRWARKSEGEWGLVFVVVILKADLASVTLLDERQLFQFVWPCSLSFV